ncbi:CzcA family heavy metal efflux pump [Bradyrhizobium sp. USDA 4504]
MIERIIGLAIRRRWVVVTLTAILMVLGGLALTKLPIDAVPDITNKQVQINTVAPALSPAEIEKQITFPIETALAGAPGLESTRSLSRNGFSQITAVFSEATDIYFARQQVGERLTEVRARLPQGIEPRIGPTSTGLGEIYMWTVHYSGQKVQTDGAPGLQSDGRFLTADGQMLQSEVEKDAYLRTVQDWIIKPQIKMVPGVAGVDTIGGYLKQYQVHPDAAKLIALGLTFADVAKAIETNNVSRGARYIERNGEGFVVRSGGRLENIDELGAVVVTTRGGVPVRIRDLATLSIGGETRTGSASENGREVVVGTALMLIGANSRTVSAAVDAKLRTIMPSLPAGIEVKTVLDRTQLVDATIGTVARNLSEGALLVIAVLFVLLGNFRAALITAMVIPVAMLMTAIGMWQGRISANLMSLGALDFGLIVDGAVIITENSLRHLAEKQHALGRVLTRDERLATVRASAAEMVQPSLYGQAIILLVYVPLLTFTGVEGKMFEPMALTVILALAAAFVLSLTLVPALIAIGITGRVQEQENRLVAALKRCYSPLLRRAVATPVPVIAVAVVLFATALFGFFRLGQEFIPSLDEKNIAMHALRIPSTALSQSQAMQLSVEKAVSRFPQVSFVFSKTGTAEVASDPMPPNASDTFIILKPREQWPDPSLTKEQLIEDISKAVGRLPGNVYEFTQPIQMRFNELLAGVRGDIAVKVFGDEFGPMQKKSCQPDCLGAAQRARRDRRQGRTGRRPARARDQGRQGGDRPARPQRFGRAGRDRCRGRRSGCRCCVRRRSQLRHRGAIAGERALRSRGAEQFAGRIAEGNAELAGAEPAAQPRRPVLLHRGAEPDQPRERQAPHRGDSQCSRPRSRLGGRGSPGKSHAIGAAAAGLLDDLGRPIREPRRGAPAPGRRGAGVFCDDLPVAAGGDGLGPRCPAGVQRGAPGAHRRHRRTLAPRHAVLDLSGGRLHRAVGRCGAERARDAELHPAVARARRADAGSHRARRPHPLPPRGDDRLGGLARLRADGVRHRHRC